MSIDEQRHARVDELIGAAEHELIVSKALIAIADVIAEADVPVRQYAPVFGHIEARLRRSAREARRRAVLSSERAADVQRSIEAHDRFVERSTA